MVGLPNGQIMELVLKNVEEEAKKVDEHVVTLHQLMKAKIVKAQLKDHKNVIQKSAQLMEVSQIGQHTTHVANHAVVVNNQAAVHVLDLNQNTEVNHVKETHLKNEHVTTNLAQSTEVGPITVRSKPAQDLVEEVLKRNTEHAVNQHQLMVEINVMV